MVDQIDAEMATRAAVTQLLFDGVLGLAHVEAASRLLNGAARDAALRVASCDDPAANAAESVGDLPDARGKRCRTPRSSPSLHRESRARSRSNAANADTGAVASRSGLAASKIGAVAPFGAADAQVSSASAVATTVI